LAQPSFPRSYDPIAHKMQQSASASRPIKWLPPRRSNRCPCQVRQICVASFLPLSPPPAAPLLPPSQLHRRRREAARRPRGWLGDGDGSNHHSLSARCPKRLNRSKATPYSPNSWRPRRSSSLLAPTLKRCQSDARGRLKNYGYN
jgi:hypothetical protein